MMKALKEAVAKIEELPMADQEVIGRQLLGHVEKLRRLRGDIDQGLAALKAGKGRAIDIKNVILRARYDGQGPA